MDLEPAGKDIPPPDNNEDHRTKMNFQEPKPVYGETMKAEMRAYEHAEKVAIAMRAYEHAKKAFEVNTCECEKLLGRKLPMTWVDDDSKSGGRGKHKSRRRSHTVFTRLCALCLASRLAAAPGGSMTPFFRDLRATSSE